MTITEKKLRGTTLFLNIKTNTTFIAWTSLIFAWLILYFIYLINHDIPANPGGYYLESAQQLAQNKFLIPVYVQGFGVNGIPFVYPPLAFYVLAVMGYLLGGILKAALYIPGILLLIQSILMYLFMLQWSDSNQVSLWAALVILFMPQMFSRTLFADGITTGLAGIFLLASWIVAIKPIDRTTVCHRSILGGIFVGLTILSHPAIGFFCTVSFTILYLYQNGFTTKSIRWLFSLGFIALVVILPWLYAVISMHGIAPLLAGLKDSKSSLSVLGSANNLLGYLKSTLSYIYHKHIESRSDRFSFFVFPIILAVIYNMIKGPRILILLLLAGLATMRGHPSVTMFVLAASLGFLYNRFLNPRHSHYTEQDSLEGKDIVNWQFLAFFIIHLSILFMLCLPYTYYSSFYIGEQETYNWIRSNTSQTSTFLAESMDEKMVYFGQRTILLPVLGAEWIPDSEYGNWTNRNSFINNEIFQCREPECLLSIFRKYHLTPDYIIYRISDDSERAWVENLNASSVFKVVFESGNFITVRVVDNYPDSSWKTP